jgi:hypothetical protein
MYAKRGLGDSKEALKYAEEILKKIEEVKRDDSVPYTEAH